MSELVVALDIGTTKVCTLVAEAQTGGTINLLGVGNVPCSGLRRGAARPRVLTRRPLAHPRLRGRRHLRNPLL